jgi:hypothetical protein
MNQSLSWVASLLFVALVAGTGFPADEKEDAKVAAAKAQIAVLDKAIQAYRVKHDQYPETLQALTEGDKAFVEASALIDPWKNPYQYNAAGPKNKGKKPDVWTVTPDKKTLGNWPEEKK